MPRRRTAELIEARSLSPTVRSLTFRLTDRSVVGHVAGQYVDLIVPTRNGLPYRRSYSIASGPRVTPPDVFEIAVTRVAEGPTSEALHAMQPGAVVEVEGPEGTFVRRPEDRSHPALFVATGTGLSPIRAMLAEEVPEVQGPPLVLLFGCRAPAHVLWGDELERWARECPRLALHVTLSRPPPDWTGRSGYVQRHLRELAEGLQGPCAYVCGLSVMVDDVVSHLARDIKLPREAIRYEPYD
jgi:CDP-4-dehydro-6-deoxyglucose reductase, E3